MSLTKQDLGAIERLIGASENRLMARIDDLDDTLSMQMEHGLQEVRDQLAAVGHRLGGEINQVKETALRVDRVQQAELGRNNRQDIAITRIRKNLHAA